MKNQIDSSHVELEKDRITLHLTKQLIERMKNYVYWTPGLTLAALGEEALQETTRPPPMLACHRDLHYILGVFLPAVRDAARRARLASL
jgi:hypothetical protein